MSITSYLGTAPLFEIEKYSEGTPKDGLAFTGYPKQHPYDPDKFILVVDPLGDETTIVEFKNSDIQHAKDLPSVVNEAGESVRIVKVWIRNGSFGVIHEPFEVNDSLRFINASRELHKRLLKNIT